MRVEEFVYGSVACRSRPPSPLCSFASLTARSRGKSCFYSHQTHDQMLARSFTSASENALKLSSVPGFNVFDFWRSLLGWQTAVRVRACLALGTFF